VVSLRPQNFQNTFFKYLNMSRSVIHVSNSQNNFFRYLNLFWRPKTLKFLVLGPRNLSYYVIKVQTSFNQPACWSRSSAPSIHMLSLSSSSISMTPLSVFQFSLASYHIRQLVICNPCLHHPQKAAMSSVVVPTMPKLVVLLGRKRQANDCFPIKFILGR
jgi:hypothetical protein